LTSGQARDLYTAGPGALHRVARTASVQNVRVSDDGSRVSFVTGAALVATDDDTYQDAAGTLRRFSGTEAKVSQDGRTVVYRTSQRLVPGDIDNRIDIYEIRDGTTARLISPGPMTVAPQLLYASGDARRIVFGTSERLLAADTDDAYETSTAPVTSSRSSRAAEPPV
jgi:hypothetical protein